MKNMTEVIAALLADSEQATTNLEDYLAENGIRLPVRQEWMIPQKSDSEEVRKRKEGRYQWELLEILSRSNSAEMHNDNCRTVLLGIKAQHPLYADGTPGYEYRLRLNKALQVACHLQNEDYSVDFAVVGAIHDGCQTTSLAEAGKAYLLAHGISKNSIKMMADPLSGYDENAKFADAFYEGDYNILAISLSVGQMMRAMYDFMLFGLQPEWLVSTCRAVNPHQGITLECWAPYGIGDGGYGDGPCVVLQKAEETRERHRKEMEKANK